jgi:hypothetical protein
VVFRVSAGSDLRTAPQDRRRRAAVSQLCMLTFPVPPSPTRTSLKVGLSWAAMLEFVLTRSARVCCLEDLGGFGASWGIDCGATSGSSVKRWCWRLYVGKKILNLMSVKWSVPLGSRPAHEKQTPPTACGSDINCLRLVHLPLFTSFPRQTLLLTSRDCSRVSSTCAINHISQYFPATHDTGVHDCGAQRQP